MIEQSDIQIQEKKLTFIPCNDSYAHYNMENYYNELGFEVWNDYKLYEGNRRIKL